MAAMQPEDGSRLVVVDEFRRNNADDLSRKPSRLTLIADSVLQGVNPCLLFCVYGVHKASFDRGIMQRKII